MGIYIGLTILTIFTVIIEKRKPKKKSWSGIFLRIVFMWIFVIYSFRGVSVGVDTLNYLNIYYRIGNYNSYFEYLNVHTIEPLFFFLNWILNFITSNPQAILIAQGIVISLSYKYIIDKYSISPGISTLSFLALGVFLMSLTGVRQSFAISLCAISIKYIIDKKPIKFYLMVFCAMMFHFSAVFFLVAYFVGNLKPRRSNTFLVFCVGIISVFFVDRLQLFASTLYSRWEHYNNIETGAQGFISFIIFLLITILVEIQKKEIIKSKPYAAVLIGINYINMIFWAMRLVTRNAERVSFYFAIGPILLIPFILTHFSKRVGPELALLFRVLVVICLAVLFLYKVSVEPSYKEFIFFWE